MELQLFIALIAIVVSVLTKVIRSFMYRHPSLSVRQNHDYIFVGCVSYCDGNWPDAIAQIFTKAIDPSRIRVGIVEYVDTPQNSVQSRLSPKLRHNVRVHTVGTKTAHTLRDARSVCIENLMTTEKYCLLARGCNLSRGWDGDLIEQINVTPRTVLTTPLSKTSMTALFPCAVKLDNMRLTCTKRQLKVIGRLPVPSVLFCSDLCFCECAAIKTVLSRESDLSVSAALHAANYLISVPGKAIGMLGMHPRGIRKGEQSSRTAQVYEYCKFMDIDCDSNVIGAEPRLGLVPGFNTPECIAKWGSVAHTRVLLQQHATRP